MNVTVKGLDGKTYRAKAMTPVQRTALVSRVHYLSHIERLSVRGIQAALEDVNSVRLSVGAISQYITRWRCEVCREASTDTEQHDRLPLGGKGARGRTRMFERPGQREGDHG